MRTIISWFRFTACILLMVYLVTASYLIYPFIPMTWWRKYIHKPWTRALIWSVGAKLEINGSIGDDYIQPNTMFVQNHISWLDTTVMSSTYCTNYVGKIEMLRWRLLRNIIKSGGTVFIDRKNKRELVLANKRIAKVMQDGWAMGLFPEGTTSSGMTVAPFHASIFESAMIAKSRVVPVVIRYRNPNGLPSTEVTFAKRGWMESVWSVLRLKGLTIKIDILDAVNATDFANREELSQYMYEKISNRYHSDLVSKPNVY